MGYARLITESIYVEDLESYAPKIGIDFPEIPNVQDMIEYQGIPSPNVMVVFCPGIPNSVLEDIRNHSDYGDGCVLMTGDDEAQIPSQAEFNEIRQFLLTGLSEDPPTISQLDEAIGTTPNGKTRWEISQSLINYVKNC